MSQACRHWAGEVIGFLADARHHFTPSMRQRIALDDLYAKGVRQARVGDPALPELSSEFPFSLDKPLAPNVEPSVLAGPAW